MKNKNGKKKIGIDIDEVLVNFMENYLEFHNKRHNTSFNLNDVTNYHLWKCGIHQSKEESVKEVLDFNNSKDFEKIDFVEGAKFGIETLSKIHYLFFITSRTLEIKEKTEEFFYSHFPRNGFEFLFSGEIYGGKTKTEICKDLGISEMIEDNPNYAFDCAVRGIKVFLLDKPWNRDYQRHENIIKVKDWKELLERIK